MNALIVSAVVALVWAPAQARADGFFSPWAGTQFGSNINNGRAGFGINAGGMGAGVVGGEVDFGFSPSFFGTQNDFGHNTVLDLMGNLILGVPIGGTQGAGVRPYVAGGVGLIRTQIDGGAVFHPSTTNNQWGWDAGAGVMGYFNDHVGARGDVRYFRNITGDRIQDIDFGNLHWWRLSVGLVIR
jgi:hypothetical protein